MKQERVLHIKMKKDWVKISLDAILQALEALYKKTRVKEFDLALMKARSYYKNDEKFMQEVSFLGKLLQLEASGYLMPPVNFMKVYRELALNLSRKEELKPE